MCFANCSIFLVSIIESPTDHGNFKESGFLLAEVLVRNVIVVAVLSIFSATSLAAAPLCTSEATVISGNWGWENNESCRVEQRTQPTDCIDTPPLGDGWGWNSISSCRIEPTTARNNGRWPVCQSPLSDPDNDGYGWEQSGTCVVRASDTTDQRASQPSVRSTYPVCSEASDPDGDGFGWENSATCVIEGDSTESLTLRNSFGNPEKVVSTTSGNFAVLWDSTFDHDEDGTVIARAISDVRTDVLRLGMQDPSVIADGYYYNTYIHHGSLDSFPTTWGNSPLVDADGNPYLVLWHGRATQKANLFHEAFHIFQSESELGFSQSSDSVWYKEASAVWYAADKYPDSDNVLRYSQLINELPHLAMWHSWGYTRSDDPADFAFRLHQYGMSGFLYYLTAVEGINRQILIRGYDQARGLTPQQYLAKRIGVTRLRESFAKWAVSNAMGMPYLTQNQKRTAVAYALTLKNSVNSLPVALSIGAESYGVWLEPSTDLAPRGWGYNVIKVEDVRAGDEIRYTFIGDGSGSEGAESRFAIGSFINNESQASTTVSVLEDTNSSAVITLGADGSEVTIVIAAIPDHMEGHQGYNYKIKIDRLSRSGG